MENKNLLYSVLVIQTILLILGGLAYFAEAPVAETPVVPAAVISDQDKADIVNGVLDNLPEVEEVETEVVNVNERLASAADEILREQDKEDLAEKLAREYVSLDNEDFVKELVDALNEAGADIDDEDDVSKIAIRKDVNVDVDGDEATVKFEQIKVWYYNDGDSDEEDLVRAKVSLTLVVEDLDEDDNYEDAEVVDVDEEDFKVSESYINKN